MTQIFDEARERKGAFAAGLLCMTAFYWLSSLTAPPAMVSTEAKTVLYMGCVLAFIVAATGRARRWNARSWLATALYAAWFAAIFYGANGALDALHGAHRKRPDVASHLGGLELWFVLCPGIVSVALGSALRKVMGKCSVASSAQPSKG